MNIQLISKERILLAQELAEITRMNDIKSLLSDLQTVRYNIKQFKQGLDQDPLPKQKSKLVFQIKIQQSKEAGILSRLENLDYKDKRGRPKKEVTDTYKANPIKFTAHLQKEQMDYVKQLQATGQIANISAFLDELITQHQKRTVSFRASRYLITIYLLLIAFLPLMY